MEPAEIIATGTSVYAIPQSTNVNPIHCHVLTHNNYNMHVCLLLGNSKNHVTEGCDAPLKVATGMHSIVNNKYSTECGN